MKRILIVVLLVVAAFVSLALLAQVQGQASMSPLQRWAAEGRVTFNANGGLSIHGGQFTREMQDVLFPKPAPKNYTTYALAESAYPTLAWVGTIHDIPQAGPAPPNPVGSVSAFGDAIQRWLGPMPDWGGMLQKASDWFWGLFTFNARAACGAGAGTCYRLNVAGSWTASNSWSATSGGASCGAACVPASTDAVVFDGNSGTGTVTLAAATTVTTLCFASTSTTAPCAGSSGNYGGTLDTTSANNWAMTIGSASTAASTLVVSMGSGTWTVNNSTINVYGEWGSVSGPTFGGTSFGTSSTVVFKSANNQLSLSFGNAAPRNVTFDSSAAGSTAITYTLGLYGCVTNCSLNMTGALTITNTGGGTGTTTLNTSASNIAIGLTSSPTSMTIASLGVLSDNASSVTVAGSWSNSGVHSYGTSTVILSANGTASGQFANLTINVSVTTTGDANGIAVFGIWTINGSFNPNGAIHVLRGPAGGSTNPLVFGASGAYGTSTYSILEFEPTTGTLWHIPAVTYQTTELQWIPLTAVAGDGFEFRADGNISAYQLTFRAQATNEPMFFNSQTFNVTLTNTIFTNEVASTSALEGIKATSGTWTIGGLAVNKTTSVNFYISFGSTTWTVTSAAGFWDNSGSTNGSRWDPGTSTVTLACNGPTATYKFGGSHLGVAEFATLNVQTNQNAGCAATMSTNGLQVSGTLTLQTTAPGPIAYASLDTSASNLPITAGSVTLGSWGKIVGESSTITVSGNWDMNNANASFTFGFGTVVFNATATISIGSSSALPNRSFYNLNIAATGTTTTIGGVASPLMIIANVLTLGTGTVTGSGSTLYIASASTTPFVNPGATIVSALDFDKSGGSFTMPATTVTGACAFIGGTSDYTVTLGGALSCTGNLGVAYYGASGLITLDVSASNYAITAGTLLLGTASGTSTQAGAFLARGSSPTFAGMLTYVAGSYVDLGSSSWTITGAGSNTWNDISTSASWNAGTSTVTFRGASGGTITPTGNNIAVAEMNVVVFDSSVAAGVTWIMGGPKGLVVAGSMTVQNTAPSPSGNTLFDTNAGNALTVASMTVSSNAALNMRSSTITVNGNWTYQGAQAGVGTSMVVFAANATFVGRNVPFSADFYDVTVNLGVTLTRSTTLMFMSNTLTVNGTMVWTGTNPSAPAMNVYVNDAAGVAQPLILGPSADISRIGLFVYFITPASTFSYNVTAGLYSQVAFEGGSSTVTVTANLLGNVTTNPAFCVVDDTADTCSVRMVTAFNQGDSAAINRFTVNLNGFTLDAAGWIGMDATLNVGSGTIIARNGFGMEFAVSILNIQTGSVTTYVSDFRQAAGFPDGLYMEHGAIINVGSGTLNVHGQLFLYFSPIDTIAGAPASAGIVSGSGTVNVFSDSGTPAANGSPGQVYIGTSSHWYIDFGTSTWTVQGNWLNQSTNASWNPASGKINFTGTGRITVAPAGIPLPEFPTVTVSGTYSVVGTLTFRSATLSGPTSFGGVPAGGGNGAAITLTPSSGYATLNAWNVWAPSGPNIDFPIHLTVSSATLTITVTNISQAVGVYVNGVFLSRATVSGNQQTMTVPGPWSTQDISITAPPGPGGGGGGGSGGNPPEATVTYTVSHDGMTYTFTVTAPSGYNIRVVTWTFGDGGTGSGNPVVHTFQVGSTYTVQAQVTYTTGYSAPVTTTILPLGPAQGIPDWLPLLIVFSAVTALVLVFISETESRRIWLSIIALAVFWAAWVYVAAAQFPSLIPRNAFAYFPLATGAVAGLMAMEKQNKKKGVWIILVVAAVVIWFVLIVSG